MAEMSPCVSTGPGNTQDWHPPPGWTKAGAALSWLGSAALTMSREQEETPPSQALFLFAADFRARSGQVQEEKHWDRVLGVLADMRFSRKVNPSPRE